MCVHGLVPDTSERHRKTWHSDRTYLIHLLRKLCVLPCSFCLSLGTWMATRIFNACPKCEWHTLERRQRASSQTSKLFATILRSNTRISRHLLSAHDGSTWTSELGLFRLTTSPPLPTTHATRMDVPRYPSGVGYNEFGSVSTGYYTTEYIEELPITAGMCGKYPTSQATVD